MEPTPHVNPAALAHFIERLTAGSAERTKSSLAVAADMTPANLREYVAGIRPGSTPEVRARLAEALALPPQAITCYCDRPEIQVGTSVDSAPRLERRCRNWLADL